MATRTVYKAGVLLVALTGLVAAVTGVWFILAPQPFDAAGPQGYSEEVDLTREEAREVSPELESWLIHVQDQVGSVSMGWGLFVTTLALTGLRWGFGWARNVLWIGAAPTLLFSAFGEYVEFGTIDTGTFLSMVSLALFVLGMILTYVGEPPESGTMRRRRRAEARRPHTV